MTRQTLLLRTVFAIIALSTATTATAQSNLTCADRDRKVANMFNTADDIDKSADQMLAEQESWFTSSGVNNARVAGLIGQLEYTQGAIKSICGVGGVANKRNRVACASFYAANKAGKLINEVASAGSGYNMDTARTVNAACSETSARGACTLDSARKKYSEGDTTGAIFETGQGAAELWTDMGGGGTSDGRNIGDRAVQVADGVGDMYQGNRKTETVASENAELFVTKIQPMVENARDIAGDLRMAALELQGKACDSTLDQTLHDRIRNLADKKAALARSQLSDPSEGSGIAARSALATDRFSDQAGSVMTNQIVGSTVSAATSIAEARRIRNVERERRALTTSSRSVPSASPSFGALPARSANGPPLPPSKCPKEGYFIGPNGSKILCGMN